MWGSREGCMCTDGPAEGPAEGWYRLDPGASSAPYTCMSLKVVDAVCEQGQMKEINSNSSRVSGGAGLISNVCVHASGGDG